MRILRVSKQYFSVLRISLLGLWHGTGDHLETRCSLIWITLVRFGRFWSDKTV